MSSKSPKTQMQGSHHVQGLRVRMGVIEAPTTPASSHVLEQAKVIGDAACGGQILFCNNTYRHVKDLTADLGCTSQDGMNFELLKSDKASWSWRIGRKERSDKDALILHMGDYLHCAEPSDIPTILKSSDLKIQNQSLLSLNQVLPPKLLNRGRVFGSSLRLKPEWIQVDGGYFDAPGALEFPLGSADKGKADVLNPFVATVFIQVDGGKAYSSKYRSDAVEVHLTLMALLKSTLRLIPGGYLAKAQDGELKYLLSFSTTEAAVFWCSQLQMASIFAPWPETALRYWPEERGVGENEVVLLFRGPRIKMGISEGLLKRIAADWTGRADVHGESVNQAARFMDAASWGGQIALEEAVAVKVLSSMMQSSLDRFQESAVEDSPSFFSKSSYSISEATQPPFIPTLDPLQLLEIQPSMEETGLENLPSLSSFASPPSFTRQRPRSSRPSKPTLPNPPSKIFSSSLRPSWELPEDHLLFLDSMTLVCEKLGQFSFKGSDEIIEMANLSPASLLARSYPSDAPQGKGDRVSLPSTPNQAVMRVELPSMLFVQEMKEEHHAQLQLARDQLMRKQENMGKGVSDRSIRYGKLYKLGSLTRVEEEEEEASQGDRSDHH